MLFAVASSCICFVINSAFTCNASASDCILACILAPHATTSPTQDLNSAPAASAFACASAKADSSCSPASAVPKEKVSVTSLPISEKHDCIESIEEVQDCNFAHEASDFAFAASKSAEMHSLTASTSPTHS